jgi:hypothetical protein
VAVSQAGQVSRSGFSRRFFFGAALMPRLTLRVCAQPGCPELSHETYCLKHKREVRRKKERGRPNYRARGYDKEYEDNRALVLRDESDCYICGDPVDKTLPGTHRDGPTADHVIRRADGGTNGRENLRLAHLRCNASRHGGRAHRRPLPDLPPSFFGSTSLR